MSAKLQALITSYCGALPRDVQAVEDSLLGVADMPDAGEAHLVAALQRVHRIRGAGGSLGFAAVSQIAAELEERLRSVEGAGAGHADLHRALESLDRLKQLAGSVKPEGSTLFGIDLRAASRPRD